MAPSFLSKLVKPSTSNSPNSSHIRGGSDSNRSPSPASGKRSRAQSIVSSSPGHSLSGEIPGLPSSHSTSELGVLADRVPAINVHGGDAETASQSSAGNPNVTVVPPSPGSITSNASLPGSKSPSPRNKIAGLPQENDRRYTVPPNVRTSMESTGTDDAPTPKASETSNPRPPGLGYASSRPQLESIQSSGWTTNTLATTDSSQNQSVRRQASDVSVSTNGTNKYGSLGHGRAATSPANWADSGTQDLTESPTDHRPPTFPNGNHEQFPSDNTITPATPARNGTSVESSSPPQDSEPKSAPKRSWTRRSSGSKNKPTGLAAAIAQSGLSMGGGVAGMQTQLSAPATSSSQSKLPPVPPVPAGINTNVGPTSKQAKRSSLSAGSLPLSQLQQGSPGQRQHHRKSSSSGRSKEDKEKRHRRERTRSQSPSAKSDKGPGTKRTKSGRRIASEYIPGKEGVPPVPSAMGASLSSSGLPAAPGSGGGTSALAMGLGSASMLGLGLAGRTNTVDDVAAASKRAPSPMLTPNAQQQQNGYFSGGDVHSQSGASRSSVGEWSTSDDEVPFDDSGSEESSEGSDSEDERLLGELADQPGTVTGFAVASSRRNTDFHELFPGIPQEDYLIEDYGCALQREILIQGRLYVSENHVCFHANIFGWITDLSIPIFEITSLEKKMTAFVIPNAIQITTRRAKYTFASFLARDTTFDVIFNVWKSASAGSPAEGQSMVSAEGVLAAGGVQTVNGAAAGGGAVRKATQCQCGVKGEHYTEKAMDIVIPGTPEKIYNLMFASGFMKDFLRGDQKLLDLQMADWSPLTPGSKLLARNMSYIKPLSGSVGPKQTKCEIRDETAYIDFAEYVSTITTTKTPDVPSGGVFSVKTRTCIMWASAVSTRVVVTTQVDWTGRSFIKGIIERSCIDGQKTYHADLDKAMRAYIQEHQSEFLPEGMDAAAVAAVDEAAKETADAAGPSDKSPSGKEREHERNVRAMQWAYDTAAAAWTVIKNSTKGALELVGDAWDQSSSTTILWFVIVILVFSNIATFFRGSGNAGLAERKLVEELRRRGMPSPVVGRSEEVLSEGSSTVPSPPFGQKPEWVKDVVKEIWEEMKNVAPMASPSSAPEKPDAAANWKLEMESILQTLDGVESRVREMRESLGRVKVEEEAAEASLRTSENLD